MTAKNGRKVDHLVVDSGAFIRGSSLNEIGDNIYTVREVIHEIKDKSTRERLQVLPYELKYREPSSEDIKYVVDFAKKTGDYPSLSAVDLKVIALTYFLEKQFNGKSHLNTEPVKLKVVESSANRVARTDAKIDGFYAPKDENECTEKSHEEEDVCENIENDVGFDADDDNEAWITPNNIIEIKNKLSSLEIGDCEKDKPSVACITSDFAVQNVLMQIGLKVVSVENGMLIRETKQFVLRCYACFKITTNMMKKFCPHCGNPGTLKRVAVKVNDKGERVVLINFRKPINVRGKRYSLPMPKSGKHVNNPILVEDQPIPQNKSSKFAFNEKMMKASTILCDPDYITRNTPFAINDVYSRASRVRRTNHCSFETKGNPNAVRPSTGNRKKKHNI